ncbi:hypothetical protein EHV15_35615 [Paenibacillus oralis]|uniref:Uncharacterized protein n=1 Tax=Paenibacillus oralis TaxID=2490856 RepID=A0A3P3TAJ2_9BACL|nr:hypothetical protein [Paenibacillus oralis]RRJ54902.1 hypothetical protein EHV15_35615 [Paenibacillus oralis]
MLVTVQNKSFVKMTNVMTTQNLTYNATGKEEFKRTSTAALRQIAKDLSLKEKKVCFNPGGIGVSGDASLYGMWEDNKGIYVTISQFGGNRIMFRTIKHISDYTGGVNQWDDVENANADYGAFLNRLSRLRT